MDIDKDNMVEVGVVDETEEEDMVELCGRVECKNEGRHDQRTRVRGEERIRPRPRTDWQIDTRISVHTHKCTCVQPATTTGNRNEQPHQRPYVLILCSITAARREGTTLS